MSKLVAIKTYERFRRLREEDKISDSSLNFILDTGQLYTHGFFLNSVVYGIENNGTISINVAGTTKTLSLSSHTHPQYLTNNSNIDIQEYKVVSGESDLLYKSGNTIYIGNSDNAAIVPCTSLYTSRDNTLHTVLDTGNFSISNTTSSGYVLNNVALFKYGTNQFQLDYVKRVNSSTTFDALATQTQMGMTSVDSKNYGFITLYTDATISNPKWAQLRIDIASKNLEFRTSQSQAWSGLSTPDIASNALNVAGIVAAPNNTTTNKVWKTDSQGNPDWRDEKSYSFSNLQFQQISGTNIMTYNSQDTRTIVAGDNISFNVSDNILTLRAQDTTYSVFSKSGSTHSSGLVPDPGDIEGTSKYLREDGTWQQPPDTWIAWVGATDSQDGIAGYMPKATIAQKDQFLRGDGTWCTLNNYSLPIASNTVLGGVKTGDAVNDITGMTAVHIKDGIIYYKDTHYKAIPILGIATSTSNVNESTTNTTTYLNIIENNLKSGGIQITGSKGTTVTAKDGVLTISSNTYKLKINDTTNGDSSNGEDLGIIYTPTSSGTGFLKCKVENDTVTWSYDNNTYLPNNHNWCPTSLTGNEIGATMRFSYGLENAAMGWASTSSKMYIYTNGSFWQKEGAYEVLDKGDWITPGNRNNTANKIVTTDSNGSIQAGLINTLVSAMDSSTDVDRIYCSNDGYIRYKTKDNFITEFGKKFLLLTGGTMTGTIIMDGNSFETTGKRWMYGSLRTSGIKYDYSGDEALIISAGTYSNSAISFYSGGSLTLNDSNGQWNGTTADMIIKKGKVGIGTNTPGDYKLYVNGNTYIEGTTTSSGVNYARALVLNYNSGLTYGYIDFYYNGGTSMTSNIYEYASGKLQINGSLNVVKGGNVGIGNNNPSYKLDVTGSIQSSQAAQFGNVRVGGYNMNSVESNANIELLAGSGYIDWHYNGSTSDYTSRLQETGSGYLQVYGKFGVGGKNTSYSFYVNGNTYFNGVAYINNDGGIQATSGAGMLVCAPTSGGWTGIDSSKWGVGSLSHQGIIRSNNTDLIHYKSNTNYTILDSSNYSGYTLPNNSTWIPTVLTNAGMTRRFGFGYSSASMGWASNNSEMYVYTDGAFYQREGAYMCLDTGNYSSYALSLGGGTMTGNISFANNGTGFRGINYGTMGDNDQWRIGGAATASNAGYMEIATADDGNEPIYVRQYTGVFGTIKRTLTLLDANGYSIFPSYINIGGHEKNASSPSYVWGSNSTDNYLRSYQTSSLSVNQATNASNVYTAYTSTSDNYYILFGTNNSNSGNYKVYKNDHFYVNPGMNKLYINGSIQFKNNGNSSGGWNDYTKGRGLRVLDSTGSSNTSAPPNYYATAIHVNSEYWFQIAYERGENSLKYRGGNDEGVKTGGWLKLSTVSTSDMRLKDVKENYSISLKEIAEAPLFKFKWLDKRDTKVHIGTSAQYWEKHMPEVIDKEPDNFGKLSLYYETLGVATCISLAKEVLKIKDNQDFIKTIIRINKSSYNGYLTDNGNWIKLADISLKHDISKVNNQLLDDIWNWSLSSGIKEFKWNNNNQQDIGVVAQDLNRILPNIVNYDRTMNLYGVDYNKLNMYLIASLIRQIETLKNTISQITAQS